MNIIAIRKGVLLLSLLVGASGQASAAVYPVEWTPSALVDYVRVAASGDGVTSSLGSYDLIFVKLKDEAAVLNPANCAIADKYAFIPSSNNAKEDMMYSTLLAAAFSGLPVQLSVSTQYCDNQHPTVYDVKVVF